MVLIVVPVIAVAAVVPVIPIIPVVLIVAVAAVVTIAPVAAVTAILPRSIVVVRMLITVVTVAWRNDTAGEQKQQTEDQAAASCASNG